MLKLKINNKLKIKFLNIFFKTINIIFIIFIIFGIIYILYSKNIFNIKDYFTKINSYIISLNIKEKIISLIKTNTKTDNENNINNNTNEFLELFKKKLSNKNLIFASSTEIDKNYDMKIFLLNTKNDSGYIHINTRNTNAEKVWINFISIIDSEDLKNKLQNNLKNLEYIDMRFGNKIYYKFYNDTN